MIRRIHVIAAAIAFAAVSLSAQQTPAPAANAGRGAGRGPMIPAIEETGYQPIFDGKSLAGWDGDPKFWRVENGTIVGQTLTDRQPEQNTFLIWRGGSPADFELKLQFKLTGFNSGIQIRSIELPDIKYAMKGYQADMDGVQQYTGQIYEERGRGFLAMRGQATYIPDGAHPKVIGNLQQTADELKALIKTGDWNQVHVIARGSTIIQILNGAVMSMTIDEDVKNRQLGGLIGFQMHVGPPMTVEFRNIWLKLL
jgi:hypothetical protein